MDSSVKKTALRMIENGVFVLTTKSGEECFGSTVTFVSQTSFEPPLIVMALRTDSGIYQAVKSSLKYALHMLGRDQQNFASAFFKSSVYDESTINDKSYTMSAFGCPILDETIAFVECKVLEVVEQGDHHIIISEVIEAEVTSDEPALSIRDTEWSYGG